MPIKHLFLTLGVLEEGKDSSPNSAFEHQQNES